MGPKKPYLGVLGSNLKKTIAIFEISAIEFVLLKSLALKQKSLNFGPKFPDFCIFGLEFQNTIIL